jgi:hypothetical protein
MKDFKWASVLIALLAASLILSLYLFGNTRQKLTELKEQQTDLKTEIQSGQSGQQAANLRQQADEAFIQGDYEKAFDLYAQYDASRNTDSPLLVARRNRANEIRQSVTSLRTAEANLSQLEEKIAALQHSEQQASGVADSISLKEASRVAALNRTIALQQKSIDSLRTEVVKRAEERQILEFVNEKGNKVYYVGQLQGGKATGRGVGMWETGGMYTGEWRNNQRHGEGIYKWADGDRYEGRFQEGMRDGFGTYYFKNGEKYIGNWKADKRHGEGTIFDKNGKIKFQGIWADDEFKNNSGRAGK